MLPLKVLIVVGVVVLVLSAGVCENVPQEQSGSPTPIADQDQRNAQPIRVKNREDRDNGERVLYTQSYALLIGNSKYSNPIWPELPTIPKEIDALKNALVADGFVLEGGQIHFNLDSNHLHNLLRDFIYKHGVGSEAKERRLFIFYSGHGETLLDRGYLVPVDAPGTSPDDAEFIRSALPFEEVESLARVSDAKHVLFCFDSCFAGDIFGGFRDQLRIPPAITRSTGMKARQFLTAGSKGERVPGQSYFTPFLTNAIEGDADFFQNGYVTAQQIFAFVRQKVSEATHGSTLPDFGSLPDPTNRGDFVFRVPKASGTPTPESSPSPPIQSDRFKMLFEDSEFANSSKAEQRQILVDVQRTLWQKSFYYGKTDGVPGMKTSEAIEAWQRLNDLAVTGQLDKRTLQTMKSTAAFQADHPASATKEKPFRNSLNMLFVPVHGTNVLFCIWETRVRDFLAYSQATGTAWVKPHFEQTQNHPAVNISWDQANAFCEWLSRKENLHYRLPTDGEWSIAVGLQQERGETPQEKERVSMEKPVYPWGNGFPPPAGAGNFADESARQHTDAYIHGYNDGFPTTAPAGSFKPSGDGLYDLSGNAWEWCSNAFGGASSNAERVMRGGGWLDAKPAALQSAFRFKDRPSHKSESTGFRVVLDLQ
jgi:formylglycine-generating enzyme required for sulfatase activity